MLCAPSYGSVNRSGWKCLKYCFLLLFLSLIYREVLSACIRMGSGNGRYRALDNELKVSVYEQCRKGSPAVHSCGRDMAHTLAFQFRCQIRRLGRIPTFCRWCPSTSYLAGWSDRTLRTRWRGLGHTFKSERTRTNFQPLALLGCFPFSEVPCVWSLNWLSLSSKSRYDRVGGILVKEAVRRVAAAPKIGPAFPRIWWTSWVLSWWFLRAFSFKKMVALVRRKNWHILTKRPKDCSGSDGGGYWHRKQVDSVFDTTLVRCKRLHKS